MFVATSFAAVPQLRRDTIAALLKPAVYGLALEYEYVFAAT